MKKIEESYFDGTGYYSITDIKKVFWGMMSKYGADNVFVRVRNADISGVSYRDYEGFVDWIKWYISPGDDPEDNEYVAKSLQWIGDFESGVNTVFVYVVMSASNVPKVFYDKDKASVYAMNNDLYDDDIYACEIV